MASKKFIIIAAFLLAFACLGFAADTHMSAPDGHIHAEGESHDDHGDAAHGAGHGEDHADEGHHGLPPDAVILPIGDKLMITNSMVVTWIVAALLILVAQMATRNVQLVPSGLQNFVEMLVEGLYNFFEDVVGSHMIKKTFWFFATVFIFVLFSNWFGLVPGVGTIGWGMDDGTGFHVTQPLLRGVNADLNMTAAMALLFFFLWAVWSFEALGAQGFAEHIFNVRGHGAGFMGIALALVFVFVGLIEIVSISVRPVALMFRLYGNVFAGENILETVIHLGGPVFGSILVLPFYFLELLVGLVQALVFALLCAVFTSLMTEHHGDHGHGEEHAH